MALVNLMPLFGESLLIGCLVCFMGSVSLLGDCGIGSKCDLHVGLFKKKIYLGNLMPCRRTVSFYSSEE